MEIYVVKKGDTIDSISSMYNIPSSEIVRINNLREPYSLYEGQILNIPTAVFNIFDYYTVKKGDTLYQIANKYDIDVITLAAINGLSENEFIYPNQTILVPKQNIKTYITKEGDTINAVSRYFNTSPGNILSSNNNIYLLPNQLIVYRKI